MGRLPYSHAIANLARRPARSALLALALALIALLFIGVHAFVSGMRDSLLTTAPPRTTLLLSTSAMRDVVRSTVRRDVAELVRANVEGVVASSAEIHMATEFGCEGRPGKYPGFLRGITDDAYRVHANVTRIAGRLPGPGEVMVGRLAHASAGLTPQDLAIGRTLTIEGGTFRVSGSFAARGSSAEGEIWMPLDELQSHAQRDDCSVVFVRTRSEEDRGDVELFASRRLDLELTPIPAETYYEEAASYLAPIRGLAHAMAWMIGLAALLSGANAFHASVRERATELACMMAMGFRSRTLGFSLVQEALWLSMIGVLVGTLLARLALSNASYRMAMTAFSFQVDAESILAGALSVVGVALAGVVPSYLAIGRLPIARVLHED